jgi:hypothetical protein
MWHNMINQFSKLFLESWFTSHHKNDFNSYNPKNVALYVKVLFKDIHINVWQIKVSRALTSPLHNEKFGVNFYKIRTMHSFWIQARVMPKVVRKKENVPKLDLKP